MEQRILLAGDQIDRNPGLGGEAIQQRFDQLLFARRVDVDFIGGDGGQAQHQSRGNGKGTEDSIHRVALLERE
ncbi:hypothetical protein [uncultured Lamprocystis sp.]|uniref:hypothetical protein n=1 Tax=uncultured Lamprocystis sp. TaxID=543132 RepID=UPI003445E84A